MANLWSQLRAAAVFVKLFPALLVAVLAGGVLPIDSVAGLVVEEHSEAALSFAGVPGAGAWPGFRGWAP